jgi:hypothetical protein
MFLDALADCCSRYYTNGKTHSGTVQPVGKKHQRSTEMKRTILVGLGALVFALGIIVGITLRPHSVSAATVSRIQSWGITRDPMQADYLVLFDSSTGEIWGYRESTLLEGSGTPIRIGKLAKVGAPIVK